MSYELRSTPGNVEFREVGNSLVAVGYAYVFDKRSQNLGGFVEQVAPGAGRKTLQERDIIAVFNHDESLLLGRRSSGTLRMEEDSTGGAYEIDLPNTTVGRDVAELLRRGDLAGSSMQFRTIADSWGETEDGYPLRTLQEFAIKDVGPVTMPAYLDTTSGLRSLAEARSLPVESVLEAARTNSLLTIVRNELVTTNEDEGGRVTPTPTARRRRVMF